MLSKAELQQHVYDCEVALAKAMRDGKFDLAVSKKASIAILKDALAAKDVVVKVAVPVVAPVVMPVVAPIVAKVPMIVKEATKVPVVVKEEVKGIIKKL